MLEMKVYNNLFEFGLYAGVNEVVRSADFTGDTLIVKTDDHSVWIVDENGIFSDYVRLQNDFVASSWETYGYLERGRITRRWECGNDESNIIPFNIGKTKFYG